jgi:hypothetical protein
MNNTSRARQSHHAPQSSGGPRHLSCSGCATKVGANDFIILGISGFCEKNQQSALLKKQDFVDILYHKKHFVRLRISLSPLTRIPPPPCDYGSLILHVSYSLHTSSAFSGALTQNLIHPVLSAMVPFQNSSTTKKFQQHIAGHTIDMH